MEAEKVPTVEEIARENLVIWMNNVLPECALQGMALQLISMAHALYPDLNKASFSSMPQERPGIIPGAYELHQTELLTNVDLNQLFVPRRLEEVLRVVAKRLGALYVSYTLVRGSARMLLTPDPQAGLDALTISVAYLIKKDPA